MFCREKLSCQKLLLEALCLLVYLWVYVPVCTEYSQLFKICPGNNSLFYKLLSDGMYLVFHAQCNHAVVHLRLYLNN